MALLDTLKKVGQAVFVGPKQITTRDGQKAQVVNFVMPIDPVSKGAQGIKGISRGVSNLFKRATSNPFAGVTVKQGFSTAGKSVLGGALKGAQIGAASAGAYSIATGDPLSLKHLGKSTAYGVTAGISLPGAALGYLAGSGKKIEQTVSDTLKQRAAGSSAGYGVSQIGVNDTAESLNTQLDWLKNQAKNMQVPPITAGVSSPLTAPVNISMAPPTASAPGFSFSPSVQAGGGMGEVLPLLLLLAGGAGAAGFALGKRKRKKYKKKRRRR